MDSLWVTLAITIGLVLLLLASGLWVSLALGAVGVILLFFFVGGGLAEMIGMLQMNTINNFTYTMIPLFVFMGELVFRSGMADKVYKGATPLVGFLPGGLLHTNIAACAVFSAVTGSSMACAATIGSVAVPEMEKRGYNRSLLTGSLAAGGSLGILIPPSLILIIYGAFVNESIGQLFMGGVFPGMALAGLFMLYIGIASVIRPGVAPERIKFSPRAIVFSLPDIVPMLVLILLVLASIYLGLATPTEAAAMGSFVALVFCALYRRLTWPVLKKATFEAVVITSWALLIVIGAQLMSMALSYLGVATQLAKWVVSLGMSRLVVFALIVIMYVILGMFIDSMSMLLLTLPITYPLMMGLGFSSVWFGVVLVVLCEMAVITPPVGINLYVLHGLTGRKHLKEIVLGIIPFFLCMVAMIVLLTAFPGIVTWLPRQMIKKF